VHPHAIAEPPWVTQVARATAGISWGLPAHAATCAGAHWCACGHWRVHWCAHWCGHWCVCVRVCVVCGGTYASMYVRVAAPRVRVGSLEGQRAEYTHVLHGVVTDWSRVRTCSHDMLIKSMRYSQGNKQHMGKRGPPFPYNRGDPDDTVGLRVRGTAPGGAQAAGIVSEEGLRW